jgi:hypothetical protein
VSSGLVILLISKRGKTLHRSRLDCTGVVFRRLSWGNGQIVGPRCRTLCWCCILKKTLHRSISTSAGTYPSLYSCGASKRWEIRSGRVRGCGRRQRYFGRRPYYYVTRGCPDQPNAVLCMFYDAFYSSLHCVPITPLKALFISPCLDVALLCGTPGPALLFPPLQLGER